MGPTKRISEYIEEYRERDYEAGVEMVTRIITQKEVIHCINDPDEPFKCSDMYHRISYPVYDFDNPVRDLRHYLSSRFPSYEVRIKYHATYDRGYHVYMWYAPGYSGRCFIFDDISKENWANIVKTLKKGGCVYGRIIQT